jgi:hypothetical protein
MSSQVVSRAKSISILTPTVEEPQSVEIISLQNTGCVPQQAVPETHIHKTTVAKEIESLRTHNTARCRNSYPVDPTTFKAEKDSLDLAPGIQGFKVNLNPNSMPEPTLNIPLFTATENSTPPTKVFKPHLVDETQQTPSHLLDNVSCITGKQRVEAVATVEAGTPHIKPDAGPQVTSRHVTPEPVLRPESMTSVQPSVPSPTQARIISSSSFPKGIVSKRVRVIAASDPGQPPSGLFGIARSLAANQEPSQHEPKYVTRSSNGLSSFAHDPLSTISQEEDMMSLASLAKVIETQTEPTIQHSPFKNNIKKESNSTGIESSYATQLSEAQEQLSCEKRGSGNILQRIEVPIIAPITPRRPIVSSNSGGSVKALAARFNSGGVVSISSPVSAKGSVVRRNIRHTRHEFEQKVISSYTMNPSSATRSPELSARQLNSNRVSDSIHNPSPSVAAPHSPCLSSLPKSSDSISNSMPSATMDGTRDPVPRYPKFRQFIRNTSDDPEDTLESRGTFAAKQPSKCVRTDFLDLAGTNIVRKSSLRRVLPGPDEPPADQYVSLKRPRSIPNPNHDHLESPYHNPDINPLSVILPTPEVNGSANIGLRRGTSVLYCQVQRLQRQLQAKADEAEQLRRQLDAKDSLKELGTLSEELRRTKREVVLWKKRAEIAEKQLHVFPFTEPRERRKEHIDEVFLPITRLRCQSTRSQADENNTHVSPECARKALQITDNKSNETVRRTTPDSDLLDWEAGDISKMRTIIEASKEGTYKLN